MRLHIVGIERVGQCCIDVSVGAIHIASAEKDFAELRIRRGCPPLRLITPRLSAMIRC